MSNYENNENQYNRTDLTLQALNESNNLPLITLDSHYSGGMYKKRCLGFNHPRTQFAFLHPLSSAFWETREG